MDKLGLNEIREKFLTFFESKGHLRLPSFPLVPQNDASLLLINAGMAPLKPYFTGKETPPSKRVTTCQKCIRTPDIERVGKTARHGTFFEMLGNFSFGDYFKHEATAWAWEFITKELKMPVDRLWVTIYEDDDEAFDIWTKEVGVAPERIVRMGKEDNFWEIGTGPCGPCSEIYFDRGEENGCGSPDCKVGCDCDRFVEFWNLVFTQFDKDENGNYNPLAHPNIDTGMGLERLAAIMQGVGTLFDVDTVQNIMSAVAKLAGVTYGDSDKTDVSLRVITDHIRSTVFMVCDGVVPSAAGRGYVLRRLLRRAARHGKLLNIDGAFLYRIADTVIEESKTAYPELVEKRDYITKIIEIEEKRFEETIGQGLSILQNKLDELKREGKTELSGQDAFKLYDTYGFPLDLTMEIVEEQGIAVDEKAFQKEMDKQKKRARDARKEGEEAGWSENALSSLDDSVKTEFVGYDQDFCEGKVLAILNSGELLDSAGQDDEVIIIPDETVFYGEGGGQVGDIGWVTGKDFEIQITDTKKTNDSKYLHIGTVKKGVVSVGDSARFQIDAKYRKSVARNHSATHLLQKALVEVLGNHLAQAGSLVDADHLRFDFSHFSAMTPEEIRAVERKVNDAILSALPVDISMMGIDEAKKAGARALFGEKYGDTVRVVKMGDYSMELCGGCHLQNTSEAGLFKITSESGVAAGVRRIEAVTGYGFLKFLEEKEQLIIEVAKAMKANPGDLINRAMTMVTELKGSQKTIEQIREKMAQGHIKMLMNAQREVSGVKVVSSFIEGVNIDELRTIGDNLKSLIECGVMVFATHDGNKVTFVVMATKCAVEKGVHCGNLVKAIAPVTGGSGGGRPDSAQAGGKDVSKIDDALALVDDVILKQVQGKQ